MPVEDIGEIAYPKHIAIDHKADNYAIRKVYAIEDSLFVVIKLNIKKYFFPFLPKVVKNNLLKFNQIFLR